MGLSLYSILFEEIQNKTNYYSAPFALFVNRQQIILYDLSAYPEDDMVAAYLKIREDKSNCPGANQVAQSARSEKYPGAGEAIYKIASTVFQKPITSDRYQSTSKSAQAMWNKISHDPTFKKQQLDNWIWNSDNETKTFVYNINKQKNKFQISDNPLTPSTEDDCILPGEPIDKDNPIDGIYNSLSRLGTPDSFETNVDISQILANHQEAVASGKVLIDTLKKKADQLWGSRYT